MQWNKDREGSSVDSSSDSGAQSGTDSVPSSRGLDPSTLYFKKEDVIMLVDDSFDTRRRAFPKFTGMKGANASLDI
jgi:hypothetical protein